MTPVLAAVGGKTFWYLTRGSGVVALLVLTCSVVLGILSAGRWHSRRWPRFVLEGLHRNVSLVVLVFLAIHVATTVLDGFVPIGWLDVVLPFGAGYRPVWVGLGAVAVDCLLAIVITSLLRVRIGHATWRNIHWLAYASWPIALVHGLGSGTDSAERWMVGLDGLAIAAVLAALWWRIAVRRPAHPVAAPLALAVSGLVPLALVAFAWTGPLQAGWSSHGARLGAGPAPVRSVARPTAGTGATGSATPTTAPGAAPATTPARPPAVPLDADLRGTRTVADSGGQRTITLQARSTSGAVDVRITLTGPPDASGGVQLHSGTVTVVSAGSTAGWSGAVDQLHHDTVTASLTSSDGSTAAFTATLQVDRAAGTFTGTVHLTAGSATAGG